MKKRVWEFAKEMGVDSQVVLDLLKQSGIQKMKLNPMSEEEMDLVRKKLAEQLEKKKEESEGIKAIPAKEAVGDNVVPAKETVAEKPVEETQPLVPPPHEEKGKTAGGKTIGQRLRKEFKKKVLYPEDKETLSVSTVPSTKERKKAIVIRQGATLSEFSQLTGISIPRIQEYLISRKKLFYPQNKILPVDLMEEVALQFGVEIEVKKGEVLESIPDDSREERMKPRPPVVVVVGHVDHGKTLLLDAIRNTRVAEKEVGGITQRIGAYQVEVQGRKITFIDTPGHRAFTAMRAYGAKVADIAILVVAGDEGVMPQTLEALDHIKAAGVEMIVAINKIDKPNARIDMVKTQLAELGYVPEDWQGNTFMIPVSARTGEGIPVLLEHILLLADLMKLRADPKAKAVATVIESSISREFGRNITLIVQRGTLRKGMYFVVGSTWGRVKMMMGESGQHLTEALPGTPVRVSGLEDNPAVGEVLFEVASEKEAKKIVEQRKFFLSGVEEEKARGIRLEDLHEILKTAENKELPLVLKAGSHGSLEAVKKEISEWKTEECEIKILRAAVGDISVDDVLLAQTAQAIILGFQTAVEPSARKEAQTRGVQIREYELIFDLMEDLKKAVVGLLAPLEREEEIGELEVKAIFRITPQEIIAGGTVRKGKVERGCKIRVFRNSQQIFEGVLNSLRRFTEDVPRVSQGYECGVGIRGLKDLMEGDVIKCYEVVKKKREEEEVFTSGG
ncbi:MAG: translation initiation factor IF-2 [bacterium JZ-2024 1]